MKPLPQRLQAFYERFELDRERALPRLGELFTDDIHFRDPFRDTRGMADFRELFERMFRQYRSVSFTGFRVDGDEGSFTLTYDMHLQMAVGPRFVTPMASVCRAREGRVCELFDFYDFSSSLVSPFPLAAAAYRKVINVLFL